MPTKELIIPSLKGRESQVRDSFTNPGFLLMTVQTVNRLDETFKKHPDEHLAIKEACSISALEIYKGTDGKVEDKRKFGYRFGSSLGLQELAMDVLADIFHKLLAASVLCGEQNPKAQKEVKGVLTAPYNHEVIALDYACEQHSVNYSVFKGPQPKVRFQLGSLRHTHARNDVGALIYDARRFECGIITTFTPTARALVEHGENGKAPLIAVAINTNKNTPEEPINGGTVAEFLKEYFDQGNGK